MYLYYVIRSKNEVLCAQAGSSAAERSEPFSFQYVRFRNEFVKIYLAGLSVTLSGNNNFICRSSARQISWQ
jgi:hypothetical protein